MIHRLRSGMMCLLAALLPAIANAAAPMSGDQPIEITSDKLDVYQDQHKAIFTGNVLAVQGTTQMRAAQMTVFYSEGGKSASPAADAPAGSAQSITRIESVGNVVFTTPTETAQGDMGIYNVVTNTIDLVGKTVTLTRDKNILKGTKLNYNMDTGRSVLTAGRNTVDVNGAVVPNTTPQTRVHGLFVPESDKKTGK